MAHREMKMFIPYTGSTGETLEPQRKPLGLKATFPVAQVILLSPKLGRIISELIEKLCLNLQMSV